MTKDDFKFYFPFIGTLFVVFGAIKIVLFFRAFGIEVVSFLDFGEIITLFLEELLWLTALVVFFFLVNWKSIFSGNSEITRNNFKQVVHEKSLRKRLKFYFETEVNVHTFVIISLAQTMYYFLFVKILHFFVLSLVCIWTFFIIIILILEVRTKLNSYVTIFHTLILNIVAFFLLGSIYIAISSYYSVNYHNKYIGTQLELTHDRQTIVTTYWYFYVGKTRNYVFLYDRKKSSYDVIPMSQIKKLSIKSL